MKIAIFGAGAIGGYLGAKLAAAGADVTFIARGPHLAAMQANGVTLREEGRETVVRPRCVGDAGEAGTLVERGKKIGRSPPVVGCKQRGAHGR